MTWKLKDLQSLSVLELSSGDILGRSEGTHRFPDSPKMSRSHCQILIENDVAYILDLNSRNGTYVDSKKIEPSSKIRLVDGQILLFGNRSFKVQKMFEEITQVKPLELEKRPEPSLKIETPLQLAPKKDPSIRKLPVTPKTFSFSFKGESSELLVLLVKNLVYTMLTIGIYTPFARTNLRKYMWKSTTLNGSPFLFKGDPMRLLKAYAVLCLGFVFLNFLNGLLTSVLAGSAPMMIAHAGIVWVAFFCFFHWARFGAYAYLVNNTTYRSVSFSVNGSARKEYFLTSVFGTIAVICTLGLYYPFLQRRLEILRWENTKYGNLPLIYHPRNWDYALLWYKGFVLTVLTLGLYLPWWTVGMQKFRYSYLLCRNSRFVTKSTGESLLPRYVLAFLLTIFTFGLAAPFVYNFILAYHLKNLSIKGSIDFDEVVAVARSKDMTSSDAIADFLDIGVAVE